MNMKKVFSISILLVVCVFITSCGPKMQTTRLTTAQSDKIASKMTDNWMTTDTKNAVNELLKQVFSSKSYQRYISRLKGKQPKIFIAELQNNTSEAYLPIQDLNDELLSQLLNSGEFILIDEAGRGKVLKEIQYQNDGMVDLNEAKTIGTQAGADLMIFGNVNMKPEMFEGKTIKEYSINLRITDVATGAEIVRARYNFSKMSSRKGYSW